MMNDYINHIKYIKSKASNTYYIVLDETDTDYVILQTLAYAGIGDVQIKTYTDKGMYDVVEDSFLK